jgi:hypothetical protein
VWSVDGVGVLAFSAVVTRTGNNCWPHGTAAVGMDFIIQQPLQSFNLTHAEFEKLCEDNPEQAFELTKDGEVEVIPPVGGESGKRESSL